MSERAARNERWIAVAGLALVAAMGLGTTLKLGEILMMPAASFKGSAAY
jgi:hypothetical protein